MPLLLGLELGVRSRFHGPRPRFCPPIWKEPFFLVSSFLLLSLFLCDKVCCIFYSFFLLLKSYKFRLPMVQSALSSISSQPNSSSDHMCETYKQLRAACSYISTPMRSDEEWDITISPIHWFTPAWLAWLYSWAIDRMSTCIPMNWFGNIKMWV